MFIFKYENSIFLVRDGDIYKPYEYNLKNEYFHDEVISKVLNDFKIDTDNVMIKKVGEIISKKEMIFSYLITMNEACLLDELEKIDAYRLLDIKLNDTNKEIILKTIIGEEFKIERE